MERKVQPPEQRQRAAVPREGRPGSSRPPPCQRHERQARTKRQQPRVGRRGEPYANIPAGSCRRIMATSEGASRENGRARTARKVATDAILVARNDVGVAPTSGSGCAERRRHREPVGQRADHRGCGTAFRPSTHRLRGARFYGSGEDRSEQRGGATQAPGPGVVCDFMGRGRNAWQGVEAWGSTLPQLRHTFIIHSRSGQRTANTERDLCANVGVTNIRCTLCLYIP